MEDEVLKFEKRGTVALLTLNRPQVLNALNQPLVDAIIERLKEVERRDDLGAVVISGSGKGFCSGHDIKELLRATPLERRTIFTKSIQVYEEIAEMGKPVIAAVHGYATAGGCGLAAACDLAVASEDAIFQTPGVNIGIFCLTPMIPLQRSIGRKKAMEMLLTGDPIDAKEAERLGLVNRVVPTGNHVGAAVELGQKISSKCRVAYEIGKPAFYMMDDIDYVKALNYAKDLITLVTLTEDAEEGLTAILEKRIPTWKNR
ncbi:MAG: enoyl-CoA hydratase-related protein [Candidatus Bathyarchaeia archaeon]